MTTRSRKSKRKLEPELPPLTFTKKLRQKLPRRRRQNFSPVLLVRNSGQNPRFSMDSSSSSGSDFDFAAGEASCNSSRASIAGKVNMNSRNESSIDSTRNWRLEKRSENEVEVSESSCADSNSFARERSRSSILKFKSGREFKNIRGDDVSEMCMKSDFPAAVMKFKSGSENKNVKENEDVSCAKSEITCEDQFNWKSSSNGNGNMKVSSESNGNDVLSFSSGVRASFEEEKNSSKENRASECEYSEGSRNLHTDLIAQSMTKQESENYDVVDDLACSEDLRFSYCDDDDESENSSRGTVFSEFRSEIFGECSQPELSDYSPSLFVDSGSQFSEGSVGETSSPTYFLFLQYRKDFTTLVCASPVKNSSSGHEDDVNFVRFDDSDDEDSYQMLRKRERKQAFVSNYGERYFSTTEFGETVLEQRAKMVHWIVEQSCRKQLRQETIFLGVNLLDRFLSKGYFKAEKQLQIVGIACLTLATRIEENQQHNRVEQTNFYIGSNKYSRCEVVAMEWMVQEVLKFQCFLPTIYNFLWFYLKAANADAVVEKRVKYLAVLTLSSHEQLCYWPSTVAAALVVLAGLEVNQSSSLKVIGIHGRSKDEDLYACIENLERLLRYIG